MQDDFTKPLTFPTSAKLQRKLNTDTSNPYQLDPWQTNENKPNTWDSNLSGASHLVNDINLYVGPSQQPSNDDLTDQFAYNKSSSSNQPALSGFDDLYMAPSGNDFEEQAIQSKISYHMKMDKIESTESNFRESKTQYHPAQPKEFDWTKFLPEQTLPFQPTQIDKLIDKIILKVPITYQYDSVFFPANALFLLSRHAHKIESLTLYENLIHTALQSIEIQVQNNPKHLMLLSFWLANCVQLLYYLKKDSQLSIVTIDQQLQLPEIIYLIYCTIIQQTEPKLNNVLIPCMLDHDIIPGINDIEFKEGKQHSKKKSHNRPMSPRQMAQSPRTVTTVLASELFVFEQFYVHPSIIQRYFGQLFYYISNSLFNLILSDKKYLCRGKALQIRMNVSFLEEWSRNNIDNIGTVSSTQSISGISQHFKPLIQLLEFLQCFTQLKSIHSFLETANQLNFLNASQIYHILTNYKYEVNEPTISEDILRVIRYRYQNFPNYSIPTNADQLMVTSPQPQAHSPDPYDTLQSSLRNVHHSLPFGAPNQVEMEDWWYDYSPFISEDTLKNLFN